MSKNKVTVTVRVGGVTAGIAEAYKAGQSVKSICAKFKVSRKTVYKHLKLAGVEAGRKYAAGDDVLLGREQDYIIQITCGFACRFSIQFEGAFVDPQPEPVEAKL